VSICLCFRPSEVFRLTIADDLRYPPPFFPDQQFLLSQVIIGTTLLYSLLGPSSLLGIALNALTIPLNRTLASITFDVDRRRSAARDARVAAIDEVIAGIRSVKFEAGEEYWDKRLGDLRKEEVRLQRIRYWLGTVYNLYVLPPRSAFMWRRTDLDTETGTRDMKGNFDR
jgi:hypothetical protein